MSKAKEHLKQPIKYIKKMVKTLKLLEEGGSDVLGHISKDALVALGYLASHDLHKILLSGIERAMERAGREFDEVRWLKKLLIKAFIFIAGLIAVTVMVPLGWLISIVAVIVVVLRILARLSAQDESRVRDVIYFNYANVRSATDIVRNTAKQDEIHRYMTIDIKRTISELRWALEEGYTVELEIGPIDDTNSLIKQIARLLLAGFYQRRLSPVIISRIIMALDKGMEAGDALLKIIYDYSHSYNLGENSVLLTRDEREILAYFKGLSIGKQIQELDKLCPKVFCAEYILFRVERGRADW